MFDFGNANEGQRKAIAASEGPVLITAGPGTGKTYTLVQRAIYLIEECSVKPESIFIATFTEKAAKELITRITNELSDRGIVANINEMYIGTFHSLCLRILKEHLEFTRLRRRCVRPAVHGVPEYPPFPEYPGGRGCSAERRRMEAVRSHLQLCE